MKVKQYIAIFSVFAAVAVGVHRWQRKKTGAGQKVSPEAAFLSRWRDALTTDARVFNGLYSGLHRVSTGCAQKPEKVLREWCQRTHYRWENQDPDLLCRQILPLIEKGDGDGLTHWAKLLLSAAEAAGITREPSEILVLTQSSINDYVEWNGAQPESGDSVRVLAPAWYQNGTLLEQGQCEIVK